MMESSPKRATRAKAIKAKIAPTANFMAGTRSTAAKRKTRTDDKDDEDLANRDAAAKRPRGGVVARKDTDREPDVAKAAPAPAPAPALATKKPAAPAASKSPAAAAEAAPRPTRGRPRKIATTTTTATMATTMAPEAAAATARVSRSASSSALNKAKATTTSSATTAQAKAPATGTGTGTGTAATTNTSTTTSTTATTRTRASSATTRGAAAATKPVAAGTGASKPTARKAVKFREPDKENLVGSKEPAATGLRGRPARRGGAAMARATTRATSKAAAAASTSTATSTSTSSSSSSSSSSASSCSTITGPNEKKPLSAIKMAQNFATWEESDDELAKEKTPLKPLMKSPIKPPTAKKPATVVEEEKTQHEPEPQPREEEEEEEEEEAAGAAKNTAIFGQLDVNAFMLGSPVRPPHSPPGDGLRSPAKRIAALGSALKPAVTEQISQSPLKTSLLQSAAKRPKSPIKGLGIQPAQEHAIAGSASKPSTLFHTPAKRAMPGLRSTAEPLSVGFSAFKGFPALDPQSVRGSAKPSEKLLHEVDVNEGIDGIDSDEVFKGPIESLRFPGRATRALSRDEVSRILEMGIVEEEEEEGEEEPIPAPSVPVEEIAEDADDGQDENDDMKGREMADVQGEAPDGIEDPGEEQKASQPAIPDEVDEVNDKSCLEQTTEGVEDSTEPVAHDEAASHQETQDEQTDALYELREKDQDPCHDLSTLTEDDDTMRMEGMVATPSTASHSNPMSRGIASCVARSRRRTTLGFSSLAGQLGAWSATSPIKAPPTARKLRFAEPLCSQADRGSRDVSLVEQSADAGKVSYDGDGDSEMSDSPLEDATDRVARDDVPETVSEETEERDEPIIFNDISFTDEDQALAFEANEMSLSDNSTRRSLDDNVSDASQEYADENQIPPDQVLATTEPTPVAVTPVRPPMNSFHTTTKIPLKPSDDSTPSPIKKRSFSAPRAAPKRSGGMSKVASLTANAAQERRRSPRKQAVINEEAAPSTPTPSERAIESWSAAETPGRTPKKDVSPTLLRGAIVFVDVHTSEGADASGIFVELLTLMGARCVKSWSWSPSDGSSSSKKVGITHVVFKDGSKRTLEKVRETNGVVQCVGVGWVLNCERANEWLDEAHYYIDTSNVPRGGARRRKSMEPKSVSNMNGSIVSSPGRSGRDSLGATPSTPRRQSTMWMASFATPEDGEGAGGDDIEGSSTFLTPVPKTPAPEAIARFAAETPSNGYDDEEDDMVSPLKEELLMRTCPVKSRFREAGAGAGAGILNLHQSLSQDEDVRVRLMAARRKSLQFAPKVGSPLAKMWR